MSDEREVIVGESPITAGSEERVLSYYFRILRRRVWVIATAFIIIASVGVVRAFKTPRVYQAVAKVLVERRAPRLIDLEGVRDDLGGWDPEFYQTKADLVRSRAVMEYALEDEQMLKIFAPAHAADLKSGPGEVKRTMLAVLGGTPAPPPRTWEKIKGHVIPQYVADTHFILIKAESTVPRDAATIANAVAKAYERYHLQLQVEMHGDTFKFLKREKDREEGNLKLADAALHEYRQKAKTVAISGSDEEEPPIIKRINELNAELTQTQLSRIDLTSQRKVIAEILSDDAMSVEERSRRVQTVPVINNDAEAMSARGKVAAAEKMVAELAETYGPEHPSLKAAKSTVKLMKDEFAKTLDRMVLALDTNLRSLKDKEAELESQYDKCKEEAVRFSKESLEITRLQNEVDRHRQLFDALVEKMLQVDVSAGFVTTNVQIVETANVPLSHIRPNKKRAAISSVFLGLFLGIGLAFLVENLDDVIKIPEDLRHRIGVPVLGFVPKMDDLEEEQGKTLLPGLVTIDKPISSAAEAYRNIRTSLFFSIPAEHSRVIGIASCGPGEGKTTSSVNIAISVALSGRKVLLIDADFHRPMVDKTLNLDRNTGLSNILIGESTLQESVQKVDHDNKDLENLDVLAAGPESPNPAELLGSKAMQELITWVKTDYDWVIIDTPPVLFVSDASIVSSLCDGIVLVVKSGKHNRVVLNRAIEHLRDININIIGSVLNMMVASRFGQYYTTYHHYGYSKYAKDYHNTYYSSKERGDSVEKT